MSLPHWLTFRVFGGARNGGRASMTAKPPWAAFARDVQVTLGPPHEPELDPPFEVVVPARLDCPLVFSSPHSGNVYPRRFLEATRLDQAALRCSEDAFVDRLFGGATALGAPLIRARFPRAYLDLNREPYELDPRMFEGPLPPFANTRSLRVAGGLGTIARVVGQAQEIYARRVPVEEAIARIEKLYKPYHACLRGLIDRARQKFGIAVLVDCHSMPSGSLRQGQVSPSKGGAQSKTLAFVVGDRYGTSCAPDLIDVVEYELRRRGHDVQRNKPYAGGFITEHYGNPAGECHAIQIEVSRALYMDERTVTEGERFAEVAADLAHMAAALAEAAMARRDRHRAAAE
ncbi:MAG TPA: N-formylglutamate amidohydrolase [Methylocella sp.]|nr:N-formylglutamate amidohydrolase [Methylocella sp.]